MTEFDEYPPDLFRLKQQIAILDKDKWWPELAKVDSHYIKLLQAAEHMKDTDFGFSSAPPIDPTKVTAVFFTVVPQLLSELDSITVGLKSGFDGWMKTSPEIEKYLEHGVVPSSLLEKAGEEPKFTYPDVIALLNSSYKFYVESLDRLLRQIRDADLNSINTRSEWAGKVQMWTAKAIEDVSLLKRKWTA